MITEAFSLVESDTMPEVPQLEPGVLYHSALYNTTLHLCPCGCKEQVVLPLTGSKCWKMDVASRTLSPSIQETSGCRSHYWITNGKVVWA